MEMTACVCKRHDPPTAVLAVLELSNRVSESCTSGRGSEPIYDHFGHAGQLKLLFWVLDNCWLALAYGVSSGAGVWRCQRDLSSSTRAAHAVALAYSTEQLLERVWCASARLRSSGQRPLYVVP